MGIAVADDVSKAVDAAATGSWLSATLARLLLLHYHFAIWPTPSSGPGVVYPLLGCW